ncbi:MAG TPA: shikimate dehydrogenase [Allosphingosinicella sp.]|nr:shikimate dehydrogenase [Allosphingosinicella sp.]
MTPYAEVIGDPIEHSLSPKIHQYWLDELGIDARYRATRVAPVELPAYLQGCRGDADWRGCNLTMPLKTAALELVDDVDPVTRRIGALNVIVRQEDRLIGANTDRQAIAFLLESNRCYPSRVAIVGTGGVARAALAQMRQAKVHQVDLVSRSPERARALLAEFGLSGHVIELGGRPVADLLINASPLGMTGHPPLALDLSGLAADATVFEMVYMPIETHLLRRARHRGLRTIDGLTMLIRQAAFAFEFFFGRLPEPVDPSILRDRLTS